MAQGFLMLEVDGDEQKPVRVFADVDSAAEGYISQQEAWVDGDPSDDPEFAAAVRTFLGNLESEMPAKMPEFPHNFDVQFESGFGSWDVRIVRVEVDL